jgi:hypothetical protein
MTNVLITDEVPLPFLGMGGLLFHGEANRAMRIAGGLIGEEMKQIDHDPNEHRKFPDYGDREWARKKFGPNPTPSDLFYYLLPTAAVAIALYLYRGY